MAVPSSAIKKVKTKTRDNTEVAVIVLIKYGVFRPYDIDKAIAAVNSKDTWVAPSNLPDYTDQIENDIAVGRETPEILAIRKIIAEHYDINLEEKEELVEEKQEVVENISEKEGNEEDAKKSSPGALVVVTSPKKEVSEDDLVEEEIDERILRILGLEDVFDIDYETYISLLREKMIAGRMVDAQLSTEETELLTDEFKRVKGKVGRFKPKKKTKIDISNLTGINLPKPTDEKSSTEKPEEEKKSSIFDGILNILQGITKIADSIYDAISLGNGLLQNQLDFDRRESENLRRRGEEERLETKKDGFLKQAKKILAPVQSIFDRILKFLVFTVLGRAFKLFMDWASNPENKKKLESIGRFLKDWWPALLGAWFFFANPLGRFIRTIIGTVAKLTFQLAKFAIPKLAKFIAANPKAIAAAALIGGGAYLATQVTGQKEAAPVQAENKAKAQTGQGLGIPGTDTPIDRSPSVGDMGPTTPFGLLQGVNTGGIIKPLIQGVSNGGNIFSGLVDKDTGETVSGAGPDTQFLPIDDGGGAVLQRGEVVLQKGARERMIRQAGVDPLAYNIGSNANKPRKINADTLASSYGGLIGLSDGGEIGTATHHLKQDEALSSLSPGINDMVKPGTPKWSKVNSNTTVHSYLDSVKQPTIGWGSTFYDSILSGKKPVRMGDKISKSKADDILNTNVSNLAKEYSTKIPYWDKMNSSQKSGLLVLGYNAPYGPIGAYPKLTSALQQGDMRSAAQHLQRGGPNASRIALERNLLLSGPTNLKNLVGPKIVGEKKVGSGIPFVPPVLHHLQQRMQKKQGGGKIVDESAGIKNPHSASDRRMFPITNTSGVAGLQPGEGIVPTDVMRNIGEDGFNRFIAAFETGRNSNAAKMGYTKPKNPNISPPLNSRGRIAPITLPPITQSAGSAPTSSGGGTQVPPFSAVSPSAMFVRINNADTYGIVG
jgi:GH24 family phage-related lysozyme (muramidase)